MTDYQRVLVDSILEDIDEKWPEINAEVYRIKLETRIEAYDNERREATILALSQSLPRLVSEVI